MSYAALNWAFPIPLTGAKKAVLVVLANAANETHECWPSQERIALYSGRTDRTVRTAIEDLIREGLVSIIGRVGALHRYRLAVSEPEATSAPPETTSGPNGVIHRKPLPVAPEIASGQSGNHFRSDRKPLPPNRTEPSLTVQEPSKTRRVRQPRSSTSPPLPLPLPGFETFWAAYPRKAGKGAARKAYAAAIGVATPSDIAAGLLEQHFPNDEKYIPHPATWLNQERWHDRQDRTDPVLRAVGLALSRSAEIRRNLGEAGGAGEPSAGRGGDDLDAADDAGHPARSMDFAGFS